MAKTVDRTQKTKEFVTRETHERMKRELTALNRELRRGLLHSEAMLDQSEERYRKIDAECCELMSMIDDLKNVVAKMAIEKYVTTEV